MRASKQHRWTWGAAWIVAGVLLAGRAAAEESWVVYPGGEGPGKGKQIVLVSGDEEYRSEEALCPAWQDPGQTPRVPLHGAVRRRSQGRHDQSRLVVNNIPGLENLKTADLMIIATRLRDLPDEQMRHVVQYVESGRPIIGLRTATHAFRFPAGKTYSRYSFDSHAWDGGFGRQILGETWINHHGHHGFESTRGLIALGQKANPIVRGCEEATSGGRPTFTRSGCPCRTTASRWSWARCSKG